MKKWDGCQFQLRLMMSTLYALTKKRNGLDLEGDLVASQVVGITPEQMSVANMLKLKEMSPHTGWVSQNHRETREGRPLWA
jgi:hypothetical protein